MEHLYGVVLAAGRSTRAGSRKALGLVDGQALLTRAVNTLAEAGCDGITVVLGEDDALVPHAAGARVVRNRRVDDGMLHSVQLGVADAQAKGATRVLVSLVDHPHVRPATVRALVERYARGDATVVFPTRNGRRGHPWLVGSAGFDAILHAPVELMVRGVLAEIGGVVEQPVDDDAVLQDLDTLADLVRAGVVPVR